MSPKEKVILGNQLPLLPIRNAVLFPKVIVPFDIGRPKSLKLVNAIKKTDYPLLAVVAQRNSMIDDPSWKDLFPIGVAARILKILEHSSGNYTLIIQGIVRIKIDSLIKLEPFLVAKITELQEYIKKDIETEALVMSLKETAKQVIQLMPEPAREAVGLIDGINDPNHLADLVAANIDLPVEEKITILEMLDVKERLRYVLKALGRQLEILKIRERINSQIKEEMGKNQRQYVLRQHLKAIREELGDEVDETSDLEGIEEQIKKLKLPEEAEKVARKQLRRLKTMQIGSAEYTVVRNYLDWILDLPWSKSTLDNLNIKEVKEVLEEDHYGLEKIKKRIIEYLAVRKIKEEKKGPILCFVGPPGVGKTSLGKSIARALGRKFVRISLGGVHDEAAIRGHRRTYVGALPGQIIQGMKKAGTNNPVFMMDEVDKIGRDFRGDPAAALLEVLDPEQNNAFSDHYLEIPFDLSRVMFITTANIPDPIPPALKDRMETLDLPGYTRREKIEIAFRHLIPKQLEEHGLNSDVLEFKREAIEKIIDVYTREAGVRNLEREIASVIRGIAVKVAEKGEINLKEIEKWIIKPEDLKSFLGPPKFSSEIAERTENPGVAIGLAWTPVGGEIIFIEATKMPGKGNLTLTGQLGDVMKESAQAALSYVRSHSSKLNIKSNFLENQDIHIHVPSGAMPKDGPSAGIAMFVALVSLLTHTRARHEVAMTGEITLRGRVLQVGGIKEKVLAAHRAGIKKVILPQRNKSDLEEIPKEIRNEIELLLTSKMDEVIEWALEKPKSEEGLPIESEKSAGAKDKDLRESNLTSP
jgi:ATP-dependent Lon protease